MVQKREFGLALCWELLREQCSMMERQKVQLREFQKAELKAAAHHLAHWRGQSLVHCLEMQMAQSWRLATLKEPGTALLMAQRREQLPHWDWMMVPHWVCWWEQMMGAGLLWG